MAILTVNDVMKSFGEDVIIENISFEVQKSDRIGLVGINGSGKTTLFKVLCGDYMPDTGSVVYARDAVVGYMEQQVCRDPEKTAYEEVLTVFQPLMDMERELDELSGLLLQNPPHEETDRLVLRQTELHDRYVREGGLTYQSLSRSALIGLGFAPEQLRDKVAILSGGQKSKLQLAKMLLGGSNLLLLDEPTNHLDIDAVEWLEEFLFSYKGAFIVISHDRYFLDKITTRTFEMDQKTLTAYKGNYSKYLVLREESREALQRVYDSKQKEIARIEGIIDQQKRWNQARNYVTIASKQKQMDRIALDMEKPSSEPLDIRFRFHASRRSGDEVLQAEDLSLSFGGPKLFEHANMDIRRGDKIFLIGPNGCGKTSLLKVLLNQYRADTGFAKFGAGVDTGYYEQSQSGLHDEKTVIDEIWDMYPRMNQTEVRSALAVFLFRGEDVFKPVGALSGGERARILLLKLMLSKTNFLLLDEPTNHLDIISREALENTLTDYDGTLLVVSHDRYLINKLADKILYLDKTGITVYPGNYDAYLMQKERAAETRTIDLPETQADKSNPYKLKKERDARLRKLRAALTGCERKIEENDKLTLSCKSALENPETASNYEETLRLSSELEALLHQNETLMAQWSELSAEFEDLEQFT